MEKIKMLWILPVSFALWLIYKIFVANEDDYELIPTSEKTGLTVNDVDLLQKVIMNLQKGGNPFNLSWYSALVPWYSGLQNSSYIDSALELSKMLDNVENKPLFAVVFAKKTRTTLVNSIIEIYGERVYSSLSQNVTNFNEFII